MVVFSKFRYLKSIGPQTYTLQLHSSTFSDDSVPLDTPMLRHLIHCISTFLKQSNIVNVPIDQPTIHLASKWQTFIQWWWNIPTFWAALSFFLNIQYLTLQNTKIKWKISLHRPWHINPVFVFLLCYTHACTFCRVLHLFVCLCYVFIKFSTKNITINIRYRHSPTLEWQKKNGLFSPSFLPVPHPLQLLTLILFSIRYVMFLYINPIKKES